MKRLHKFRIYYNETIHPELRRMERLRKRLIRLIAFSFILLLGIFIVQIYLSVFVLSLLIMLLIAAYIGYLVYRIRKFTLTFKPHVVSLVLDFIDDAANRGELTYKEKAFLPKETFLKSQIFATAAPLYEGEDFIAGRVGQMDFTLSELHVREMPRTGTRLNTVFKGVFSHAVFPEYAFGRIIVWPRSQRKYLTRAIREFTFQDGQNADEEVEHEAFKNYFITYATEETKVHGLLSPPMQAALAEAYQLTGKPLYVSFNNRDIYLGIWEDKDMLEPKIFRSNLSFELVREFFEDVQLLLRILEIFDETH